MAEQKSSGMQTPEEMAAERYQVVRGTYWFYVTVVGGGRDVGRYFTEAEAERVAVALRTAFIDGARMAAELRSCRAEEEGQ